MALAQLAHKRGELLLAVELYDALLESGSNDPLVTENRARLERNRQIALNSIEDRKVAAANP